MAPRHGVAIKGGADLTLTGSGFVYPAVRAPLDGTGWMIGVVTLRGPGRWESYPPWNLESLKMSSVLTQRVFFFGSNNPVPNIV